MNNGPLNVNCYWIICCLEPCDNDIWSLRFSCVHVVIKTGYFYLPGSLSDFSFECKPFILPLLLNQRETESNRNRRRKRGVKGRRMPCQRERKTEKTERHKRQRGRVLKECIIPVLFVVVPVCRVREFERSIKAWLGLSYPVSHSSLSPQVLRSLFCQLGDNPPPQIKNKKNYMERASKTSRRLNTEQLDNHSNCGYQNTSSCFAFRNTHHANILV